VSDVKLPVDIRPLSEAAMPDSKVCADQKRKMNAQVAHPEKPLDSLANLETALAAKLRLLGKPQLVQQVFEAHVDMKQAKAALQKSTARPECIDGRIVSELLGESGSFTMSVLQGAVRTFLPCINGQSTECAMHKYYGFVGCSWMSNQEFTEFAQQHQLPPQRTCVLCHWVYLRDVVGAVESSDEGVQLEDDVVLQQFTHATECPGGYAHAHVRMQPQDHGIDLGVFGPIVMFRKPLLSVYEDRSSFALNLSHFVFVKRPDQRRDQETTTQTGSTQLTVDRPATADTRNWRIQSGFSERSGLLLAVSGHSYPIKKHYRCCCCRHYRPRARRCFSSPRRPGPRSAAPLQAAQPAPPLTDSSESS
jgi:hypothetical protein